MRPIECGRPGPGLLAHVLVSKYCDHLPLYRQSRIFAREGIDLDRSTLAGWVGKATALLEPLADAIGRHVLAGQALFADDTPVKVLAPGTGKCATGRAWTYVRDERRWKGEASPAAWYRFSADRKAEHPKAHLAGFGGWMHSDGYAGFGKLTRAGPFREVACLAHVRREFFDVHAAQGSAIAAEALDAGHFWGILETRPYMRARAGPRIPGGPLHAGLTRRSGHLCAAKQGELVGDAGRLAMARRNRANPPAAGQETALNRKTPCIFGAPQNLAKPGYLTSVFSALDLRSVGLI